MPFFRFFLFFISVFLLSCNQDIPDQTALQSKGDQYLVARYRASVFSQAGSTKKEDYVALLEKAEKVELLSEMEVEQKGKKRTFAKIRLMDGKEGFLDKRHLARKALLVITDRLRLYRRPVVTSGRAKGEENLKSGTIAFLEAEEFVDVSWFEISGGSWNDGSYFRGWVKESDDIVSNADRIAGAVRFENIRSELEKKGQIGRADYDELKDLSAQQDDPVSSLSRNLLEQLECQEDGNCSYKEHRGLL